MSLSESTFLFDIKVQDLISYVECKNFYVRCQFADIFNIPLRDPNDIDTLFPKKKKKLKEKVRDILKIKTPLEKHKTSQSILFDSSIDSLIENMRNFPIELSLRGKDDPDNKVGSTRIPWSIIYFEYLNKLTSKENVHPAFVSGGYNVFDEATSKRMAIIRLNVKLTFIKDKTSQYFQELFENKQKSLQYAGYNAQDIVLPNLPLQNKIGVIKTSYSEGKRKKQQFRKSKKKIESNNNVKQDLFNNSEDLKKYINSVKDKDKWCDTSLTVKKSRSDTDLNINKHFELRKGISHCILNRDRFTMLNYIYGSNGPFGSNTYYVGYFTVENDKSPTSSINSGKIQTTGSGQTKSKSKAPSTLNTNTNDESKERYKFRVCKSGCLSQTPGEATYSQSQCSLDLPQAAADFITVKKCTRIDCGERIFNEPPTPPDDRVLLDLAHLCDHECGRKKIEEISGEMKAKQSVEINDGSCFCTCECTFGFVKKTTYCKVCGGFEKIGEDYSTKNPNIPFPCPIYHKIQKAKAPPKIDPDRDSKKKKKKKDDRFKFNYGYTAPQIGHSQCAMPCTNTLGNVPKNMGWLWTADNVPGLKFRPLWRPGAANKHVVRQLKIAKNPGEVLKRRRKETGKKKRPLKRPLLIVQKKEGEYTVTMETMKTFTKPRMINQHPYEDKPVLTYTIGRTEEENRIRRLRKERVQRRLEREQREYIQSAFTDVCKEICLKTYRQALGLLKDAEDPECLCYPVDPDADRINLEHSCSCSLQSLNKSWVSSDTDSDEWIVEFTPPNATFDPTIKPKKIIKVDNTCQYTYLDYKVKLLDRYGNPVPRYFKGPDGKTQCSDLGGFWSPEHKWLEINIDGYIAPDCRWAPMAFTGPSGEQVDCENGKFQATNGKWIVVGVDGFIDQNGKWKFYPKPRGPYPPEPKTAGDNKRKKDAPLDKKQNKKETKKPCNKPSEMTWSCFGDVTPKALSKLGIMGHGHDKRTLLATLQDMLNHGEDVQLPTLREVPHFSPKKGKGKHRVLAGDSETYDRNMVNCNHPVPSAKGILAVDGRGNKTYFRLKDSKNMRPNERLVDLTKHGISLSSFHVPCLNSFINAEMMKKELIARRFRMAGIEQNQIVSTSTQIGSKDVYGPYTRHLEGIA